MSHGGLQLVRPGGRSRRATAARAALVALTASSLAATATAPAGAAAAARAAVPAAQTTLCSVRPKAKNHVSLNPGAYVQGKRYWVQDDRFGSLDAKQCLTLVRHGRPAFRVSTSEARSPGYPVQAYPYIQYGCYWGWCTPGSNLPVRITNLKSANSRWYTREHARGIWNAGFDMWLHSRPLATAHANRAEVMVWLHATFPHYKVGGQGGTRKVKILGTWFYVSHWRTGTNVIRGGWEYVQYRLVHSTWHTRKMHLGAILANAVKRHLISKYWYLQGILAGNEIWYGGTGLRTSWFSAIIHTHHPVHVNSAAAALSGPGPSGPPVPLTGLQGPPPAGK
jgi:hypothetical protein